MVKGLREVSEIISKGKIGRTNKCKSIDDFHDQQIISCLREVRDLISKITGIVNTSRLEGTDMYNIVFDDLEAIDQMKKSIIDKCNLLSKSKNLDINISPS
jgi:hypothetical protein